MRVHLTVICCFSTLMANKVLAGDHRADSVREETRTQDEEKLSFTALAGSKSKIAIKKSFLIGAGEDSVAFCGGHWRPLPNKEDRQAGCCYLSTSEKRDTTREIDPLKRAIRHASYSWSYPSYFPAGRYGTRPDLNIREARTDEKNAVLVFTDDPTFSKLICKLSKPARNVVIQDIMHTLGSEHVELILK